MGLKNGVVKQEKIVARITGCWMNVDWIKKNELVRGDNTYWEVGFIQRINEDWIAKQIQYIKEEWMDKEEEEGKLWLDGVDERELRSSIYKSNAWNG